METHFKLTDTQFEEQFRNATLHPALFNHEAHLRLAWIHIKNYGIDKAITHIRRQLKNYVAALQAKDKYNETVTIAAVRAVYHFMLKSKTTTFKDFISENKKLRDNFKALLACHYKTDIFNARNAKTAYLPPELLPFD